MAKITINSNLNLSAIAAAAGQSDNNKILYRSGVLHVKDVSQAALDAAVVSINATAAEDTIRKAKDIALAKVDGDAGKAREILLTTVPGQAMTYLKKEADAEKFKADGYPEVDIDNYPWIAAEARARSDTGQQVADLILTQAAAWTVIGVAIEEERIRGKVEVEQQQSVTGVNNASDKAKDAISNARNR